VTRVLDDAVAMGANVVRTFLQPVIGALDGSSQTIWHLLGPMSSDLNTHGVYLLYWETARVQSTFTVLGGLCGRSTGTPRCAARSRYMFVANGLYSSTSTARGGHEVQGHDGALPQVSYLWRKRG
jgi:hypothetical protein